MVCQGRPEIQSIVNGKTGDQSNGKMGCEGFIRPAILDTRKYKQIKMENETARFQKKLNFLSMHF